MVLIEPILYQNISRTLYPDSNKLIKTVLLFWYEQHNGSQNHCCIHCVNARLYRRAFIKWPGFLYIQTNKRKSKRENERRIVVTIYIKMTYNIILFPQNCPLSHRHVYELSAFNHCSISSTSSMDQCSVLLFLQCCGR